MRKLTNTSLYIIVLDYLVQPGAATWSIQLSYWDNERNGSQNGLFSEYFFAGNRPLGLTGSKIHETRRKNGGLMRDVFISKQTFFCCIPVFQSFLSLTLHIPLLVKGTPLTYTLDKFRARKCIFWTVLSGMAWNILICVIDQAWGQDGWIIGQVLLLRFYGARRISLVKREDVFHGRSQVFISCFVFISSPRREGRRWMDK